MRCRPTQQSSSESSTLTTTLRRLLLTRWRPAAAAEQWPRCQRTSLKVPLSHTSRSPTPTAESSVASTVTSRTTPSRFFVVRTPQSSRFFFFLQPRVQFLEFTRNKQVPFDVCTFTMHGILFFSVNNNIVYIAVKTQFCYKIAPPNNGRMIFEPVQAYVLKKN